MSKSVYIKTYKTDKNTSSLLFDGVDDHITLPNLGFAGNVDISVEAWIYINSFSSNSTIFSFSIEGITRENFTFVVESTGQIVLGNWLDNANSAAGAIKLNQWMHVACTYNASTRRRIVYVDGLEVANAIAAANLNLTDASYSIGRRVANLDFFKGYIQDVRIWNVVRTQDEIRQNNFTSLLSNETGLLEYYKLNEGAGTEAIDSTLNKQNGTLTNFTGAFWNSNNVLIAPVYTRTYRGFSEDYTFNSINSQVNGGFGSVRFTLPREFDVLESQDPQNLEGFEIDVISYDQQQPSGIVLFSGDVSIAERQATGDGESVSYTATSPLERLSKIDLEASTSVVTYSAEIGAIFKDIINLCNQQAKKQILKYSSTSIANTGKNISITFKNAYIGDALKAMYKLTNVNYIWYIDSDKTVYLKELSATPDHYFFSGKDISSIKRTTDRTKVVNILKLWDGLASPTILRKYINQNSIDKYGYSATEQQDGRIASVATALELGTRTITSQKEPNDQIEIVVIDSSGGGYDIDTTKVGDTFQLLNYKAETNLPNLLVITSKTDYLDHCVIIASDRESFISRELAELKSSQSVVNNGDLPDTVFTQVAV